MGADFIDGLPVAERLLWRKALELRERAASHQSFADSVLRSARETAKQCLDDAADLQLAACEMQAKRMGR